MMNDWSFADKEFARTVLHVVLEDEPIAMPVVTMPDWEPEQGPLGLGLRVLVVGSLMASSAIVVTALYLLASWIFP